MPSLRNRKVKGISHNGRIFSPTMIRAIKHFYNRVAICMDMINESKPTIDEYVKGKCFGCGAETTITTGKKPDIMVDITFSTDGKYCSDSCNPSSHVVIVEIYNYETEGFEVIL